MNAFKSELTTLVARHVAAAPTERMLHLVETLSGDEPALEFGRATAPAPCFTNLGADGRPTEGAHVAVYQHATGLTWTAGPLLDGKELTHAEALKAAFALELLGKRDWRAPTIQELLSIVDYGRCDPAVDPKHFKGPHSWTWSSTVAAAPAGYAWYVNLDGGDSSRDHQDYHNHALAVRAGQQLGLSV